MSKHQEVETNSDKPYEEDVINFMGIIYFGVGLFLLIVVTFGLMWVLQYHVLVPYSEEADVENAHPMAATAEQNLPPNERLQSAPGFGIESKDGWIDLELREPQAEWKEREKQNKDIWENGEKSEDGKTVIAMPIREAKEKLLSDGNIKAKTGDEGEKALREAKTYISGSSAGREASAIRK